jgi:hypothetical protein
MELTLEHLPDDPVCVPVSTESYARRLWYACLAC